MFFERFVFILGMARISGWIEGLKEKYWHFQEGAGGRLCQDSFCGFDISPKENDKPVKMLQKPAEN